MILWKISVIAIAAFFTVACGEVPKQTAAPWREIWVPYEVDPRVPTGSRRLTTAELRTILPGSKLIPVERIITRWDECDETFVPTGVWVKCANPNGIVSMQYISQRVVYQNDMFCVIMKPDWNNVIPATKKCSYIYIYKNNLYYINNFYSNKKSSLIQVFYKSYYDTK
jgi:hypothetical protein